MQQAGHKPIVLMGGGTTKVGDPTGKDESRKLLTDAEIDANIAGIRKVFERFLTFGDGPTDAVMVNNDDWLSKLEYVPFLRDVGRHFTINRMLTFDSVRMRLEREQPLTFLEFNYMILQAYDFLELSRRAGCRLQLGGSDQWGNIVNGIELDAAHRRHGGVRRDDAADHQPPTAPKMGKTAQGAVWLNEEQLSPYDYWQFWRNTRRRQRRQVPAAVHRPAARRNRAAGGLPGAQINEAKIVLATEATAMLHGREAAEAAARDGARRRSRRAEPAGTCPRCRSAKASTIAHALTALGFTPSNKEAKRKIAEGAVRLNDEVVDDAGLVVTVERRAGEAQPRQEEARAAGR